PPNPNVSPGTDCNDTNPDISPQAIEVCDGIDNDCDGLSDDSDNSLDQNTALNFFSDTDGDGYGNPNVSILSCTQPSNYVLDNSDCDDSDGSTYVGAAYNQSLTLCMRDSDGDGFGDSTPSNPNISPGADCNDSDNGISPAELEICGDGIDNNCDGNTDDPSSSDALTWYYDNDGDGTGDANNTAQACDQLSGYVDDNTDCDDNDSTTYVGAAQNDDPTACMSDTDGDGFGDSSPSNPNVDAGSDCDDNDSTTYVGAAQNDDPAVCMSDSDGDGYGNSNPSNPNVIAGSDCDDSANTTYVGAAQNDDPNACMSDFDGDGYGDSNPTDSNTSPGSDCDDGTILISPAASEVCDSVDNDCDGLTDDADGSLDMSTSQTYFSDADGDGFGDPNVSLMACAQPSQYVLDNTDCNDDPVTGLIAAPDVAETCDFVDNNCDGVVDAPGTVAFFPTAGGLPIDMTMDFTGTNTQPATPLLNTAGTVVLCDGSYYVNMTVRNDVVLSPNGSVVLDGAETGSIVNIDQSNVIFEASDMTFMNGLGSQEIMPGFTQAGGGLACFGFSEVILDNVVFTYNVGDLGGGLISIACNLNITNSEFNTNAAIYGGGIYATDGIFSLSNTLFQSNFAETVGGGAVFGESNISSSLTASDLEFFDNESDFGAGLNLQILTANVSSSTFEGNAGALGG
ncbi:MAG: MopE-related protein, partial [Myxococcota bacterium]|nr:MopE-related protein [Myxococcota bacterium]